MIASIAAKKFEVKERQAAGAAVSLLQMSAACEVLGSEREGPTEDTKRRKKIKEMPVILIIFIIFVVLQKNIDETGRQRRRKEDL